MKTPATKDIIFVSVQLLLFVIYFTPLLDFSFQPNSFIAYSALILAIIGLLIILLAFLQMNTSLTPFPTPRENGKLIQNGLYKYIRHPIYSGIILAALGFGVFRGSLWQIFVGILLRKCRSIGISNYNSGEYLHREFYKKAESFALSEVDVFLMDGESVVLPCENEEMVKEFFIES